MRSGFSQDTLELILARSQGQCEVMSILCTYAVSDVHHRRPRGMGGTDDPAANMASNGIAICRRCHMWVESNRTEAMDFGFLVSRYADPEKKPIWWRRNRDHFGNAAKVWCLLLNDGSRKVISGNQDITPIF